MLNLLYLTCKDKGCTMAKDKKKFKKRRKKRKFRKLFISAAAFVTAAVVVVFCIFYIIYDTDFFNISAIDVYGNKYYDKDYIIKNSGIKVGEKIFKIDKSKVTENVEKEVYIKSARLVYELPDRVYIETTERKEKYQVFYNNEYIVIDKDGVVLNKYKEKSNLLTIESLTEVIYNIGDNIKFNGIDDINTIFNTLDYCTAELGSDVITKLTVAKNNSIILNTEYGTEITLNLKDDVKYEIAFALKIINDRLNNNLTVTSDLIDFTKGDSPVYIEDYQMEENK